MFGDRDFLIDSSVELYKTEVIFCTSFTNDKIMAILI